MKPLKPLNKFWNRSPFFYKVRNTLLFRNITENELNKINYNSNNPIDSIPQLYIEINKHIFKGTATNLNDFDKAIKIATWLRNNIKGGKGLGIDSENALKYMLEGGYGVCSDFCQVFNNFCVINDLKVREWGLKKMNSYTDGHSFNEFYSKELNKWIFIDVSGSFYFIHKTSNDSEVPLSTIEVFNLKKSNIVKETNYFSLKKTTKNKTLKKFYYSDNMLPFIVDNYSNAFYDKILKRFKFLPIPFIHGLAIILNKSYNYKIICEEK